MSKFQMSSAQLEELRAHTLICMPQEACALLIGQREKSGNWQVSRVAVAKNIAERKEKFFEVDPALRIGLERDLRDQDDEIIGVFHSHPNGHAEPSKSDESMIIERHLIWLVASIDGALSFEIGAYQAGPTQGFKSIPLVIT
ncbi:MAG: M67 family metallopeptidase [Sneathiella sp.]